MVKNRWIRRRIMRLRRMTLSDMAPCILVGLTGVLILVALVRVYSLVTMSVIDLGDKTSAFIYIKTGSGFDEVSRILSEKKFLTDPEAFAWLSRRKSYDKNVKPGKYQLKDGMSNNELVNMLRAGMQIPVRVTIRSVRASENLAGLLARQLELDSTTLDGLFRNREYLRQYGAEPATLFTLFIADTYEFWWTVPPAQLFTRMKKESDKFWTPERRKLADSMNLTPAKTVILASIVEKETNRNDEKPVVAGVYLNRLRIGMPLQADPTILFAWNDTSIKRVKNYHTLIDSPYNTYQYKGLPPGPICLPSVSSIDAVLHAKRHDFLYFCAREDLTGYHNFASTLADHNKNARRYQKALNKLNIK